MAYIHFNKEAVAAPAPALADAHWEEYERWMRKTPRSELGPRGGGRHLAQHSRLRWGGGMSPMGNSNKTMSPMWSGNKTMSGTKSSNATKPVVKRWATPAGHQNIDAKELLSGYHAHYKQHDQDWQRDQGSEHDYGKQHDQDEQHDKDRCVDQVQPDHQLNHQHLLTLTPMIGPVASAVHAPGARASRHCCLHTLPLPLAAMCRDWATPAGHQHDHDAKERLHGKHDQAREHDQDSPQEVAAGAVGSCGGRESVTLGRGYPGTLAATVVRSTSDDSGKAVAMVDMAEAIGPM
ncbi:hypothetical protein HaLaN_11643 [Haematococcus lacustris]|uniref:Uncharacterized protein n=1 Tax=Haematococcus lacustris TaxID=44745 RepID=A0A699Z8H7_HAELA|nr:hypothetical protein HaLaN_11643 [Haematococcus lacustris]